MIFWYLGTVPEQVNWCGPADARWDWLAEQLSLNMQGHSSPVFGWFWEGVAEQSYWTY